MFLTEGHRIQHDCYMRLLRWLEMTRSISFSSAIISEHTGSKLTSLPKKIDKNATLE